MNRITKDRIALWGLGEVYALRCEEGVWYQYPNEFPVYLIDRNGYLYFQTEEQLLNTPYVVVNPRKNGGKLVRFSEGIGSGHCSISQFPDYICVEE